MDILILVKATGSIIFAVILFLAVFLAAGFSTMLHMLKFIKPLQFARKTLIFKRK